MAQMGRNGGLKRKGGGVTHSFMDAFGSDCKSLKGDQLVPCWDKLESVLDGGDGEGEAMAAASGFGSHYEVRSSMYNGPNPDGFVPNEGSTFEVVDGHRV
eukprot:857156-Prorocentrum_minimum.AAC.1